MTSLPSRNIEEEKIALATDMNIPTGYRLFMNDTHSPDVGGIGFVISPRCSYRLISSEFFTTRIGRLVFDISRRRIHILSIYDPTAIDAHSNETMSFYDVFSSIVDAIATRDRIFLCDDFSVTLPVDKVIGFSALFVIDVAYENPIHLGHL